MARRPKFDEQQILDAALALLAEGGVRAVTVAAIARQLGAPSGSIYHRFAARDLLLARLWLRTVAWFQADYLQALRSSEDPQVGIAAAVRFVLSWCRTHPAHGRLLLLYRRHDLLDGAWPDEVASQAQTLANQIEEAMASFLDTHWPHGELAEPLLRLAAISIPQGAATPYLRAGRPIPPGLDDAVVRASLAVLRKDDA
ncbi:MAG: TetR/AcrR family transcriptional regulator [Myxococcota bacterium]